MNLRELLTMEPCPWEELERIEKAPPDNILEIVQELFPLQDSTYQSREFQGKLIRFSNQLHVEGVDQLLHDWVDQVHVDNIHSLLYALNNRNVKLSATDLLQWLNVSSPTELISVVAAAGNSGDRSLAPWIASKLDLTEVCERPVKVAGHAAIALGRLGAADYTDELCKRLPDRGDGAELIVALELMNDRRAVKPLIDWLQQCPPVVRWQIHETLMALTGSEPLVPWVSTYDSWLSAIAAAWLHYEPSAVSSPSVKELRIEAAEAHFALEDTAGAVRVAYSAPPPGSAWPRWEKSLRIAGEAVYDVGSVCDTCETTLKLIGWSDQLAAVQAAQLRNAVQHVDRLTAELFESLDPLLKELRPGHYHAILADLDIEYITSDQDSWWTRRRQLRAEAAGEPTEATTTADGGHNDSPPAAFASCFQLRKPIPAPDPTYGMIMPSRDLATLSPTVTAAYIKSIAAGQRPLSLALGWLEYKDVFYHTANGFLREGFLIGVLLDGHHKLAAYAAAKVPARTLLLCRLEDCAQPFGESARVLQETTASLKVGG